MITGNKKTVFEYQCKFYAYDIEYVAYSVDHVEITKITTMFRQENFDILDTIVSTNLLIIFHDEIYNHVDLIEKFNEQYREDYFDSIL